MSCFRVCVICLVVSLFLNQVLPTDVPGSICESLVPSNLTGPAQTRSSPYYVKLSQTTYSPTQRIGQVVLSSDEPFVGFILQARALSTQGNSSVGEFLGPLPFGSQYLQCTNVFGTVTNKGEEKHNYLAFYWKAPKQDVGKISFRATFIYNSTSYWTGVEGTHELFYQLPNDTLPTSSVPTTPRWCPIMKCTCHGGTTQIVRDKYGCIVSCHCKYACPSSSFQCKNGLCISGNYKCDGDSDCEDNSDEEDCPSSKSNTKTNYWYTPGRNAAVGVAIILMLVIVTYYMYRRYMVLYGQQDHVNMMSGQSWFRRPSQRERHETQLEMINAIIEARLERQIEQGQINGVPADLPPYSPTDDQNVQKPPPSYDQACGMPPPEYTDITAVSSSSSETLNDALNTQSTSSDEATGSSSSTIQRDDRVVT